MPTCFLVLIHESSIGLAAHDALMTRYQPSLDRLGVPYVVLVLSTMVAACGFRNDSSTSSEDRYRMGESLSDSSLAVIVASDFGLDTLTTEAFHDRISRVVTQMPEIVTNPDQVRELRKSILEDFLMLHGLFGEAERVGVRADSMEVQQRFEQILRQFPSEEAFRDALESDSLTEEELRENIEAGIIQEALLTRFREQAEPPSEKEVMEYREHRARQVRVSHILFMVPPSTDAVRRDSIRQQAATVLDSIKAGSAFAEMARRYSADGTAQSGGDLGFFSRGDMVLPFEEAAFALRDSGDVTSDLVETRFGWHIIQLTGKRMAEPMDSSMAHQFMLQERQIAASRRRSMRSGKP